MTQIDFPAVNASLLPQIETLLREWFPRGRISGHEYCVGDITGVPGKSLKINLRSGKWKDFAGDAGGNDIISLFAKIRGISNSDAARELSGQIKDSPAKNGNGNGHVSPWEPWSSDDMWTIDELRHPKLGQPSQAWHYPRHGYICRFDLPDGKKEILPLSWCRNRDTGEFAWQWKAFARPRPLYKAEIRPRTPILIVEGEKTCDAAQALLPSFSCVSWPGGGNAVQLADWSSVAKAENVFIWPDNDEPGRKTALVLQEIIPHARIVRIPEGLPEKWDLADKIPSGLDVAKWILENGAIKQTLRERIERASKASIVEQICPEIAAADIPAHEREEYARLLRDVLEVPIREARKLVRPPVTISSDVPQWCRDWVWVVASDSYYELSTNQMHSTASFNNVCGNLTPINPETGARPIPSRYCAERGIVRSVAHIAYLPECEDQFTALDGKTVLNSYDHSRVPSTAEQFTEEGRSACALFVRHIRFLCGGDHDTAQTVIRWLAHQVQFPGRKIRWSIVIQSIEGVGKSSIIGGLMRAVMGERNVGVVQTKQFRSDYNGYATGVALNFVEELRVSGMNRHEIINELKPLITDDWISINEKYVRSYNTRNTCNYLCFTNHKDALPLREDDRRWFVIFCPAQSMSEYFETLGCTYDEWIGRLLDALQYAPELRKWLMDVSLAEFPTRAPMTSAKAAMVETEIDAIEGLAEAREIIARGENPLCSGMIVSTSELFHEVKESSGLDIQTSQCHQIMKRLGYSKHGVLWINGKAHRIWTRHPMTSAQVRALF